MHHPEIESYRDETELPSVLDDRPPIAGHPRPSAAVARRNGVPIERIEAQKIRALDALGLSRREIARAVKRGRETVRRVLAGETARQSGQGRVDRDGRLITESVEPPVRCATCRGMLREVPCRLCWQRAARGAHAG